MSSEDEKRTAAVASVGLVENGMTVGLGTGSTVAYLLPALAARGLDIRCVATSPRTATAAGELGLRIVDFSE
ncbi:MAG: ribose-5-phosphate isomerase RpiA, partial [Actinobacteria bacterium]|nr:ribose-5-phosphate isomerase RpiA [Actinomycetota bacterium]